MAYYNEGFGEIQEDIEYLRNSLEQEFYYAKSLLDTSISETERERWRAAIGQISIQLSDLGSKSGTLSSSLLSSIGITEESPFYPPILRAGFDFESNWPVLAIIGIGAIVALRGGKKKQYRKRRRIRR